MIITNIDTYNLLRNQMTEGVSMISHRYNVAGETHINKFELDPENKTLTSSVTENILTNIYALDANSLHASVASSQ